ncbi:hypothetical protein ALC56_05586 [Trachymyrmex septentrionalis]|uniref:Uncharacterized protein n=1 Tax=Trachymyrmex septentrionalis TaxID=34720 RepID=A0A151JXR7_9HYME|nr:hypothetical protein ALC56_05586 [Trachymyrmex septentrionalis]
MAVGFAFSFFVCEHLPRFPLQSSPSFTTAAATILPLTPPPSTILKLINTLFFIPIRSRKNCVNNLRRLQHSWQVYREDIVKGILTRSLNGTDFFGFSSVSTICIKYSETLDSIALYGDDPLDCPYLPVTYPNPIESPPTLA